MSEKRTKQFGDASHLEIIKTRKSKSMDLGTLPPPEREVDTPEYGPAWTSSIAVAARLILAEMQPFFFFSFLLTSAL